MSYALNNPSKEILYQVHICKCLYRCGDVYVQRCICIDMCIYLQKCVFVCSNMHTYIYVYISISEYKHTCMFVHKRVCIFYISNLYVCMVNIHILLWFFLYALQVYRLMYLIYACNIIYYLFLNVFVYFNMYLFVCLFIYFFDSFIFLFFII